MGFFDKLTGNFKTNISSVGARISKETLSPVDYVNKLLQYVDENAFDVGHGEYVVPNHYTIIISQADFDVLENWVPERFANELRQKLVEYADECEYRTVGDFSITFEEDVNKKAGDVQISSESERNSQNPDDSDDNSNLPISDLPVATDLKVGYPAIEISGKRFLLTEPITTIGRGSDCSVILEDPGISRHHIELRLTEKGVIAQDCNSTNGMFIEGHQVPLASLVDGNTITIGKTTITFLDAMVNSNMPDNHNYDSN